ncbi:MAG: UbiA family prenyltransferase, partial [Betaproteobacteria bacterium]
ALPQAFLGIAFSFGIPMAFAAANGSVEPLGWWMLAINLAWVVAYDTEYAMVDRDDDLRIGLRTSAITFGRIDVLAVAICYAVYIAGMVWVGRVMALGPVYFLGLLAAVGCVAYHLWLIRGRERERCFRAFLHNHWLGFAIFAGTVADYAIRANAWPRGA